MRYYCFIVFLFLLSYKNSYAQPNLTSCNCCTQAYKQFNFWLGNWDVFNQKDEKIGSNNIISMQDSCVIQENWSSNSQTGTSYTFYNKTDSTWNQIYLDNLGTVLQLKGYFINNKMILESEKIKSKKGNFYYFNRITWELLSNGNVSQKWDIVDDKGTILQVAFDGIYKKKIN